MNGLLPNDDDDYLVRKAQQLLKQIKLSSDSELAKLLEEARLTPDVDRRLELMQRAGKLARQMADIIDAKLAAEAKAKGYELIQASVVEVGLLKNGRGIRTWFASTFDGQMPTLGHPVVQEAIRITEEMGL